MEPCLFSWVFRFSSLWCCFKVKDAVSWSCSGLTGSVCGGRSSCPVCAHWFIFLLSPGMEQTRNADAVWHFIPPGRVRLSAACTVCVCVCLCVCVCVHVQMNRKAADWGYVHCEVCRAGLHEYFHDGQKWGRGENDFSRSVMCETGSCDQAVFLSFCLIRAPASAVGSACRAAFRIAGFSLCIPALCRGYRLQSEELIHTEHNETQVFTHAVWCLLHS